MRMVTHGATNAYLEDPLIPDRDFEARVESPKSRRRRSPPVVTQPRLGDARRLRRRGGQVGSMLLRVP
jgi:hypothetical protein